RARVGRGSQRVGPVAVEVLVDLARVERQLGADVAGVEIRGRGEHRAFKVAWLRVVGDELRRRVAVGVVPPNRPRWSLGKRQQRWIDRNVELVFLVGGKSLEPVASVDVVGQLEEAV